MTTQVDGLTSQQYRDYITQQTQVASASGEFSVDDFYSLLAAQLKNQDLYNAQDDAKFLEQMVQIYNIQNMKEMSRVMAEMNQMTMTSYAFEFMGKEVTVATLDEKGELTQITGMVEKVVLYNGDPQVYVDGQAYGLGSVMEVITPKPEDEDKIEELEEQIEALKGMLEQSASQGGMTGGVKETPENEESTENVENIEGAENQEETETASPENKETVESTENAAPENTENTGGASSEATSDTSSAEA